MIFKVRIGREELGELMAATILDGTKIASEIRAEVAGEARALAEAGMRPGLAVVLVGHNPASEIYVRGKVKSCEEVGIYSEKHTPPDTVTTDELLALVDDLNRRDEIDGILVQLPLPAAGGLQESPAGGRSGERRRRLPSHERRLPLDPAPGPGPVHPGRRDGNAAPHPHRSRWQDRPWSSGAATSSASRWRCCC